VYEWQEYAATVYNISYVNIRNEQTKVMATQVAEGGVSHLQQLSPMSSR